jgi:hypothetical protein
LPHGGALVERLVAVMREHADLSREFSSNSRRNLGALVSDHRPCADLVRIGTRFVVPISDPPRLAMTNVASMKAFFFVQCASIAKLVGNIR